MATEAQDRARERKIREKKREKARLQKSNKLLGTLIYTIKG